MKFEILLVALLDVQQRAMVIFVQDNDKEKYMPVNKLTLDVQQTRDLLQRVERDANSVVIQKSTNVDVVCLMNILRDFLNDVNYFYEPHSPAGQSSELVLRFANGQNMSIHDFGNAV